MEYGKEMHPNDNPYISYFDGPNYDLKYAYQTAADDIAVYRNGMWYVDTMMTRYRMNGSRMGSLATHH